MENTLDVRCGIKLFDDMESGQTIQMRSVCTTDGELCYSEGDAGLYHYLYHEDGVEDPTAIKGNPAHASQLWSSSL